VEEYVVRELSRQFRENIGYSGDVATFDKELVSVVSFMKEQCARVVEETPGILFVINAKGAIGIIADAVRRGV